MIKIGIKTGMRGIFPYMYDEEGPIMSGLTCKNYKEAKIQAIAWAKADYGKEWKQHCDFSKYRLHSGGY